MLYYNNESFEENIHFSQKKIFLTGEFEIISSLKFVPIKFTHFKTSILPVKVASVVDFPVMLIELFATRIDLDSSIVDFHDGYR